MTEGVESGSAAEDGLDLTRWGTRFARAEMEAGYRAWHVEQAVPFNRAGLWGGGVVLWLAVMVLLCVLDLLVSWVPVILFVVLPAIVGAALTTYRRSLHRWMLPSAMAANTIAGFVVVGLVNAEAFPSEATVGSVVLCSYFGMAVLRARPVQAAIAVAPYMAVEAFVLVRKRAGGLAPDIFLLIAAYLTGLMISFVLDIVSRRSYRQERIIERQKETIARERARSEALLKNELSHQIAERSRELGHALARSGPPVAIALPAPGDRFHRRYRVVRPLGEGGMGAVFEVERLTDSQRFALKLLTGRISGATAVRFAREAEIGSRVHHANLISIVDVGIAEGGAPFLAMELVSGGSVEDQRPRFGDPIWAKPLLRQMAEGLAALHEAGVVHRDLKPSNILLQDGVAKISDFGISRFGADEPSHLDPAAATLEVGRPAAARLTTTGALLGTPLYMAPESAFGAHAAEAASDLFAFGILAYEMLTARSPFDGVPMYLALQTRGLPAPEPIRGDERLSRCVLDCLGVDPTKRPTMREVGKMLGRSDAVPAAGS